MRSFTLLLVLFAALCSCVACAGSGWNIDKAVSGVKSDAKKIGNKAKSKSEVLKARAEKMKATALKKSTEMRNKAQGKPSSVQEAAKKRADLLMATANEKAKSIELQARKMLDAM